uniref:MEGF10_11 n=2 Tax=Magallana gigas TaxID=29159 RepID=A0A8W8L846_MAGGI|nr:uncharacterized protein LOC117681271 isoform X1 [Crassostrea gigas]
MCEEIEGWVQTGTTCCYNYYHNGSTCVHCLAGYFGGDCVQPCGAGFYGKLCVHKCDCDLKFCNHEKGCLTDFKESSISVPENSTHLSTLHVSTIFKSHLTVSTTSKPSESMSENYVTTSFIKTESTNDLITSISKRPNIATTTTSSKPTDTNIYLMAIGGVIALFLGILIIQFCVKLCLKRRKYSQQLSLKRTKSSSVKEEETYQDINEALMTIRRYDNPIEHRQHGKYFELQTAEQILTFEPYDQIKSQTQYQEIADSTVISSTSSDSNNSSTSYLKPKSSKRRSYVDVIDTTSSLNVTNDQDNVKVNQNGKDFELQTANPLTAESCEKINKCILLQKKDIVENHVALSTSSGSSNSNKSYLKPTSNQRHSYIEVLDSKDIPFQDTILHVTDGSRNSNCSVSSQYLDPIHNENLIKGCEIGDHSDGYLDVTHKTIF